jgi:hypothetical protein
MACWVMNINYVDIMKNKDKWSGCNEMFAFNYSLSLAIYRTARTSASIFGIVPAYWFFHFVDKDNKDTEHPSHEKCGHVLCILISALTSLLLLLFLWWQESKVLKVSFLMATNENLLNILSD